MITINGLKFAASKKQFINGLFDGATFDGTYEKRPSAIVLRDLSGSAFGAIVRFYDTNRAGLVAVSDRKNGGIFYGQSYNELTLKKLGVESIKALDLESLEYILEDRGL